jgi:hypothetical protein
MVRNVIVLLLSTLQLLGMTSHSTRCSHTVASRRQECMLVMMRQSLLTKLAELPNIM